MASVDPIFIVGAPRSGTTLLQCLLAANRSTFSLPETHYFSGILPALGWSADAPISNEQLVQLVEIIRRSVKLEFPVLAAARLARKAVAEIVTAMDVWEALIGHYRPAGKVHLGTRLIEKTPGHLFHMSKIRHWLPGSKFINIIRDPRDVVSSMLKMPTSKSNSALTYAQGWNDCVQAAVEFEQRHAERILSIRYEDLILNMEPVLRKVCEFNLLQFEKRMLDGVSDQYQRCVLPHETWKREVGSGEFHNKSGVWRQRISPGQAWLVEQATRKFMAGCRYVAGAYPTRGEKLAALRVETQILRQECQDPVAWATWQRHLLDLKDTLTRAYNFAGGPENVSTIG